MTPSFGSMMRLWPPSTPKPGGCSSRMTVWVTPPGEPFHVPVRSGCPSGRRGIGPALVAAVPSVLSTPARPPGRPSCPARRAGVAANIISDVAIDTRRRARILFLLVAVSRPRVVDAQIVEHRRALVVEQADVFLPLQRHPNRPRAREYLRIRHRRFVLQRVSVHRRVAFNDLQRVAMVIAGHVEPRVGVE